MRIFAEREPFALPLHQRTTPPALGSGSSGLAPEDEERYNSVKRIERYILEGIHEGFRFSFEHAAAILLMDMEQLRKDGALSVYASTLIPSSMMKMFLNSISPFCRHYMLHLDLKNLTSPHWKHAVPMPLEPQPEVEELPDDHDHEHWKRSRAYHTRFNTNPDLTPVLCDPVEEATCNLRDQGKCVVTGKPSTRTFWILPFTWNDTVEHNDATGRLHIGCTVLTGINLAEKPYPTCNAHILGATHKAWNMLSIDETVYRYMKDGFCALEYQEDDDEEYENGNTKLTLKFNWMPKLRARFGLAMDIHSELPNDWTMMYKDLDAFENCPQPTDRHGEVLTQEGKPLRSGHIINITMPERDARRFRSAIKVHWGCIKFTALCGAAGRPWLLSGKPEDKSMQKLQYKARKQDDRAVGSFRER
ncbi:hypothetical protein LB507_009128, partial [Fusarium sp. FIESC RH6]